MPITGTPVPPPAAGVSTPPTDVTLQYDVPILPKRRSLHLQQGLSREVDVAITDAAGDPVDLSAYSTSPYTVGYAIRETTKSDPGEALWGVASIKSPASDGLVSFTVPEYIAVRPGIYIVEVMITNDTSYPRAATAGEAVTAMEAVSATVYRITTLDGSNVTRTYDYPAGVSPVVGLGTVTVAKQQLVRNVQGVAAVTVYLVVDYGIHGGVDSTLRGAPTMAEVRLHIRDFPEGNLLIDEYEFDVAEVALCAQRCVDYFNEIQPPLNRRFTTNDFPARYHWLEGIVYQLFLIAASWYRRNRMAYQAGGVQIDDTNREQEYLRAAQMHERNWKEWVMREKARMTMEEGVGSFGSDYRSWNSW